MIGTLGRMRFTLKFPDGTITSYGSHNCHNDDGRTLVARDGGVYLESDSGSNEHAPIAPSLLPSGTMAANGYYEHERDEWVPVESFVKK